MKKAKLELQHFNATPEDFVGNNGIGRYVFLPGSDTRAKEISTHFDNLVIKTHPRGHNLYLGTLEAKGQTIEVAAISSGMGCPSMEIILHELFYLGARRFLRIGTAGSLQPWIRLGAVINAQAAVRDEDTTERYLPREFPAIASLEFTSAILLGAEALGKLDDIHTGTVHCKAALYAREFNHGPRHAENIVYNQMLTDAGVLASEMETSALFILTQLYNHSLQTKDYSSQAQVLAGAILTVVKAPGEDFDGVKSEANSKAAILLGLETIKVLASQEAG